MLRKAQCVPTRKKCAVTRSKKCILCAFCVRSPFFAFFVFIQRFFSLSCFLISFVALFLNFLCLFCIFVSLFCFVSIYRMFVSFCSKRCCIVLWDTRVCGRPTQRFNIHARSLKPQKPSNPQETLKTEKNRTQPST